MIAAAAAYAGTPGVTSHSPLPGRGAGFARQVPSRSTDHRSRVAPHRPHAGKRNQMIGDLVKIKMLTVNQGRIGRTVGQDLIIEIGAGVDADRRSLNQPYRPHGEQVGRARSSPNEVNGHSASLIALHAPPLERAASRDSGRLARDARPRSA